MASEPVEVEAEALAAAVTAPASAVKKAALRDRVVVAKAEAERAVARVGVERAAARGSGHLEAAAKVAVEMAAVLEVVEQVEAAACAQKSVNTNCQLGITRALKET